jgi:hypothetical protein
MNKYVGAITQNKADQIHVITITYHSYPFFPLFEHITNFGLLNLDRGIEITIIWWYDITVS